MHDVAIIGAGDLGGAIASAVARSDLAASICLFDEQGSVAAGKALDIMQSAPILNFSTRVSGTSDIFQLGGASLIVIADRAGRADASAAEWQGDDGLAIIKRTVAIARDRLMLCAGANQCELVDRGVRELQLARTSIVGSAPEALASAIRAFVALEANRSPRDVSLTVLARPPHQTVVPWDQATVGGVSLVRLLEEPARRRLSARVAPLWPPGPIALSAAAVKAIRALSGISRETLSCFVAPDDSQGRRARAVALPSTLDPSGLVRAEIPYLNGHDRTALDNAMLM